MYELIMDISMVVIMLLGIAAIAMPEKVGKKSLTETKKGVLIVRLFGAVLAVGGLFGLLLLTGVISFY